MRVLSATELLEVWEDARRVAPPRRSLRLLAGATGHSETDIERWPIGRRERALLELRSETFGPTLYCVVRCPMCADRSEACVEITVLTPDDGLAPSPESVVRVEGYEVVVRLPTTEDLLAVSNDQVTPGTNGPAAQLLDRCVVAVRSPSAASSEAAALPAAVREAVEVHLALADPSADVQLNSACVSCGHRWSTPFDAGAYFWAELQDWARCTLLAVHRMAQAYGWTEAEVLGLSASRRQVYLELLE